MHPTCTVAIDGPFIQELLDKGYSYAKKASELQRRNVGNTRGLSERSVRRFVKENQMRKANKEGALITAIEEVSS